jgi:succinate dehydrogenase / fumarate reductase cytochrome b subunit
MTTTMTANPPLLQTTIGKKIAMAGSGVILLLWLIAHMLGNLKLWLGTTEYNEYAHFLRRVLQPPFPHTWFLWLVRIITCAALVVHVYYAIVLARRSRKARVTRYAHTDHIQADAAALTMRWGGLTIFLFVIFHLSMFTWGWLHPGYTFHKNDPSANVIGAFNVWWMVVIYAVALAALSLHVYHASWSMFQTFGINSRRWDLAIRRGATVLSAALFIGFMSLPVGVLAGAIT